MINVSYGEIFFSYSFNALRHLKRDVFITTKTQALFTVEMFIMSAEYVNNKALGVSFAFYTLFLIFIIVPVLVMYEMMIM